MITDSRKNRVGFVTMVLKDPQAARIDGKSSTIQEKQMAHPSVALSSGKIEELENKTTKKALPVAQRKGVSFPKFFTQKLEPARTPYDEIVVGDADRRHRERQRRHHL